MNILASLLLSALAAAAHASEPRSIVAFGRDVTLEAGQSAKEVVVIGGSAKVLGSVRDSVVVVGGDLVLDGPVGRDAVVVLGSSRLEPAARVGGDAVAVGGTLEIDPAAEVRGDRQEVSFAARFGQVGNAFGWLQHWAADGLFKLRLIPHDAPWAWAVGALLVLGYVLVGAAAAGPVGAAAHVLEAQPATAFLAGLLIACLAGPMSLLLLVSVFGIVFVPFLAGAGLAAAVLGKAAVFQLAGTRLGLSGWRAVLAGGALALPLLAVPVVALPLWLLVTAWGLGAAALASVELVRRETAPSEAPMTVAAQTAEPAAPAAPAPDALGLPRASFGLRLGATAIDVVAVGVIALITPVLTFGVFAWAAYQVALWTWKGTTFGGIVLGIRGVRVDGKPMDLTVAAVRHLASWFSAFPAFLGFFWAGWDPEGRTWHDKIAGTVVVRVPKTESLV
ncbi:RDD family protein [bacterium]|nr:MAG: RDD family protein [bacterium]